MEKFFTREKSLCKKGIKPRTSWSVNNEVPIEVNLWTNVMIMTFSILLLESVFRKLRTGIYPELTAYTYQIYILSFILQIYDFAILAVY
jgi:hypothetical protein